MLDRKPMIAGNWKMFKTVQEAVETATRLAEITASPSEAEVMIAPGFVQLHPVAQALEGSRVALGAQDLFWEKEGAYTGAVSASMLLSAGCAYVLVGHSERRQFFGETDETVNKKIRAALESGLKPVFCVGETESERNSNKTFSVLDKQVRIGLKNVVCDDLEKLVLAYEPVWAIGTGKTATCEQAQEVHAFLRKLIEEICGNSLAKSLRILYGGSVKPNNVEELMSMPDVDGALVGGASLDAETFGKIVYY